MGIRFYCPQGHKLNVKEFQAGRRGICPFCGEKILIPTQSSRPSSKEERQARRAGVRAMAATMASVATQAPETEFSPPFQSEVPEYGESLAPESLNSEPSSVAATVFANPVQSGPPAMEEPAAAPAPAAFAEGSSKAPDALADAPDVVWYVRPPTGGQFGPATSDIIRGWLAEGRISIDTLVWREGWRDWLEAGSVFPQLNLPYTNPLAALNAPPEPLIVPQTALTPSPTAKRPAPKSIIWLIAALGVFTLLVIATVLYFWLIK